MFKKRMIGTFALLAGLLISGLGLMSVVNHAKEDVYAVADQTTYKEKWTKTDKDGFVKTKAGTPLQFKIKTLESSPDSFARLSFGGSVELKTPVGSITGVQVELEFNNGIRFDPAIHDISDFYLEAGYYYNEQSTEIYWEPVEFDGIYAIWSYKVSKCPSFIRFYNDLRQVGSGPIEPVVVDIKSLTLEYICKDHCYLDNQITSGLYATGSWQSHCEGSLTTGLKLSYDEINDEYNGVLEINEPKKPATLLIKDATTKDYVEGLKNVQTDKPYDAFKIKYAKVVDKYTLSLENHAIYNIKVKKVNDTWELNVFINHNGFTDWYLVGQEYSVNNVAYSKTWDKIDPGYRLTRNGTEFTINNVKMKANVEFKIKNHTNSINCFNVRKGVELVSVNLGKMSFDNEGTYNIVLSNKGKMPTLDITLVK